MSVDITQSLPPLAKQFQDKIEKFNREHPELLAQDENAGGPFSEPSNISPGAEAPAAPASVPPAAAPPATTPLEDPAKPAEPAAPDVHPATTPIQPGSTDAPAGDAPAAAPPAQTLGTDAAPKNLLTDDEWEDINLNDEDTGYEYKFKAPKTQAEFLKRGYLRQSDYSRKTAQLTRNRAWMQPMIESGDLDRIAPLIQMASSDAAFAEGVLSLYRARLENKPLVYQQPGYEQTQTQAQPQQQLAAAQQQVVANQQLLEDETIDPYTRDVVLRAQQPLLAEIQQMRQYIDQQKQTATQAQQQQQQQQVQRQQHTQQMINVHAQLAARYPNDFQGPNSPDPVRIGEVQKLAELDRIATAAGLNVRDWGYVGRFEEAMRIKNARPHAQPQAHALPPSAAAESIAQVQANAKQIAQQAAARASANVASNVAVNGGPAPAPAPRRRTYKDKDGKLLPMSEQIRRAQMNAEDRLR